MSPHDNHAAILEENMIAAVTAFFRNHDAGEKMTGLRALEVRAVTDNGDLPTGGRMIYRTALTTQDLLVLAAPWTGNGTGAADAPMVPSQADHPTRGRTEHR